jgi:lysine biosynthesis protein LysW
MTEKATIKCVECRESITLPGKTELGQVVTCPECGTEMEVIALDPAKADWVYNEPKCDEEEDW